MRRLLAGIVLFVALCSAVIAIHTPETRYSVEQTTIEQRGIVHSENRYGILYTKPVGGYGEKGASQGSFGEKGGEEGASNLPFNDFIARGSDPKKISNIYASARGYQIINEYVKLEPAGGRLTLRPQINGTPSGDARVVYKKPNEIHWPTTTVYLRTKDLPPLKPLHIYEAWLLDEDTGFAQSIGIFQPSGIGRIATLEYSSTIALTPYDALMVTVEPYPDSNPGPGEAVLLGSLQNRLVTAP